MSIKPIKRLRQLLAPALSAALLLAPALLLNSAHAAGFWDNLKIQIGNHNQNTFYTENGQISMKLDGNMTFAKTEDDVIAIDGKAWIEEKRNNQILHIEFSGSNNGPITRRYMVDGHDHALDADGKRWLASVIPVFLRESAIDAEKRVARIFNQGGAAAVLTEIEHIDNNFARRIYLDLLCQTGPLNDDAIQRVLTISSRINSDFDTRTVLLTLIKQQTLSTPIQTQLLNRVAKIDSDFEKRTVMVALAPKLGNEPALLAAWQKALAKVSSDFDTRTVLMALEKRDDLSAAQIESAIQASNHIDSAFDHRTVLVAYANHIRPDTPALAASYLKSAQKIDSDFDRRTVLIALLNHGKLDKSGFEHFLDALKGMSSDFDKRTVLIALAKQMPADDALVEQYHQIASTLGDFDRTQAEKALKRVN